MIVILAVIHSDVLLTLYNEQPNVRESHSTLVTSGYQEQDDNIEGDNVNVTDKRHSEPTLSFLIILSHQAGVRCIDTLSYTEPTEAIHSNRLLLLVPNTQWCMTHAPNGQRSLCCHQCIPCSSSTRENREIYMTQSTCCPCTYTAGRFTDQG